MKDSAVQGEPRLRRQVGIFGATMMGLGSVIGTGIFVSIGIAAGAAGPSVTLAVAVAALVATCNALSSAQLAANHPVSGGTYEYGYRWLHPAPGFTAGWMFLCAKTASAATAALGFAGYVLTASTQGPQSWQIPLALVIVVVLTVLVLTGYGRIATLGEEIREPRKNIPRAIIATPLPPVLEELRPVVVVGRMAEIADGQVLPFREL